MFKVTGEWLNGRVAVSKTVGCVFESRLPCQIVRVRTLGRFFVCAPGREVACDAIGLPERGANDRYSVAPLLTHYKYNVIILSNRPAKVK